MTILRCVLLLGSASAALSQQIEFTTRAQLDSPVVISTFVESKVYGFDSVSLKNDGSRTVTAVQLLVTIRDEVAEERRVAVEIKPHETRRIIADLGHLQGLRQKIKSTPDSKALAVLSIKTVEFPEGEVWRPADRIEGTPVQEEQRFLRKK